MQTPRPDHFTYPPHGNALGAHPAERAGQGAVLKRPWLRAVFVGGLIGFVALGFALSLTSEF